MTTSTLPKEGRRKLYKQIYTSLETELNSRSAGENPLEIKEISAILTLLDKLQDLAKDTVATPRAKKAENDDITPFREDLTQRLSAAYAARNLVAANRSGNSETLGGLAAVGA